MRRSNVLVGLVDLFVGIAEAILVLRVLFKLFNANGNSQFVHWIYQTSDTLMAPFRGIFPATEVHRGFVLDVSALFAILMYAILGYLLAALLSLIPVGPSTTVVTRKR